MTGDGHVRNFGPELAGLSVPVHVGPYFVTDHSDLVHLGEYAA